MKQTGISSIFSLIPSLFNKVDVNVINRYNQAIQDGCNHEQAYQAALTDTSGAMIKCNGVTQDAISAANGQSISLSKLTLKSKAAALGMKALNWAMSTLVMVGVSWAISSIANAIQEYQANLKKARQETMEAGKVADETNDKLQEYIAIYHELAKTGGSADQLKDLQQQIADLVGVQADNLDLVNGKLDDELEKLRQISIKQAQKNKGDLTGALVSAEQDLEAAKGSGAYSGYSRLFFEIDDSLLSNSGFMSLLDSLGVAQRYSNTGEFTGSFTFAQDSAENLYKSYQACVQAVTYMKDNMEPELLKESALYNDLTAQIGKYSEAAKAYGDALNAYNQNEAIIAVGENLKTFTGEINDQTSFNNWVNGIISAENATGDYADAIWEVCGSRYPQFARESDSVANELNKVEDAAEGAKEKTNSFATSLSNIKKLGDGLDELAGIYEDIKDGGSFDLGALISDDFVSDFGNLDSYEEFIKIVANSPNDISACQEAFNKLSSEYVQNSDALKNVSDETRDVVIAMLEQKGIANATAIVDSELALQKERLKQSTNAATISTTKEALEKLKNAAATDIEKQALAQLLVEKLAVNNKTIDTSDECSHLLTLANTARATAADINRLTEANGLFHSSEQLFARAKKMYETEGDSRTYQRIYGQANALLKRAQELANQPVTYQKVTPEDFKYNPPDDDTGSGSKIIGSETNETAEKKIKNLKHRHEMGRISEKKYYEKLEKIRKRYYAGKSKYLDRDRALQEEYHDWKVKNAEDGFEKKVEKLQKKYINGKLTYSQLKSAIKKLINTTFKNDKDTKNEYLDKLPDYLKDAVESKEEKNREDFDLSYDKLKYQLENGFITEATYYKKLDTLYKKHYGNKTKYLDEYSQYSQEVYDGFKDMYKEDLEAKKDAWEKKKDAVSEYYDKLREEIENTHDEEDYEKEQSEKRKEIFDLDMQIAELMRDGSEKAKARIAELEEERLKAEEDLLDFETDKAREDELSRLEKEQKAEEDKIQAEIDKIDDDLKSIDENITKARQDIIKYARAKGVKLKFAYASGTRSSVGGYGRINEKGVEMISAPDGNGNYIPMLPNSYVFSAKATEFLWKLATEHSLPQAMYNSIAKSIKTQSSTPSVNIAQPITITMGDVIIKGNADKQTVADIKKEQENTVRMVLQKIKELQK